MKKLIWTDGERHSVQPNIPCYHAKVKGGYYRVAPVTYRGHPTYGSQVLWETFWIPDGAKSAADVRDIKEGLPDFHTARDLAQQDYNK